MPESVDKPTDEAPSTVLHGTCVAMHGQGILITGASGSGKSGLALSLMSLGAELVADDRVIITLQDGCLVGTAPEPIKNLIEARGIGLLKARCLKTSTIDLVVDLDRTEHHRLPQHRDMKILERTVPLLHKVDSPYFAAALLQYVKTGRQE